MTPDSNPGAGAPTARPPAATPREQGAGVPRPVMSTYVNLGTAVRASPTPQMKMQAAAAAGAPGIQAYPRAVGAAVPTARPCMPLPHTQGAPAAGVLPRPMSRNLGGAPMPAATSPMPRVHAARPGVPANTRPVGAAVPSTKPRMPGPMPMAPTQPALVVPNPAAPSPGKRPPTTMGTAIPPAKRHAPTQGAPTGGTPLPANLAAVAAAAPAPTPARHAQGAPGNATPQPAPAPKWRYFGVHHDPGKGWMARVMDPKRGCRDIGPFDDEHQAALAHDRVAVACAGRAGGPARLNFVTAFYPTEAAFLRRWEGDICDAVEKGGYEEPYAKYLKAGYKVALSIEAGDEGDEPQIANCVDAELFWDVILEFFIDRASEIGQKALREGGDVLMGRFVEMYRNMALCPSWRATHQQLLHAMMIQKKHQQQQQQQIQMQQQQQEQQHIQMQQQQQLHIQMQQQIPMRQQHIQMQQQIPMQQQHIQMQQQHIQMQQQQMMIQKQQQHQRHIQMQQQQMMIQKQEQMMTIQHQQQHQQQHLDGDAILQVKHELI